MENGNLLAGRKLPPIICTLTEAKLILGPVTAGYAWGEKTIVDLWTRCAPTPDSTLRHEKRIISPAHLGDWLADVLNKRGIPLDAQAELYNLLATGAPKRHVRSNHG